MNKDTLVLAHYYTTPDVQAMADFVGDSLDLALHAKRERPKRIVFAGVRFMAETAKMLNPEAEVILPDAGSTCSLVEQTDLEQLRVWVAYARSYFDQPVAHVAYINSSAAHKTYADMIVTSRNVVDIVKAYQDNGYMVLFSPDRNMGAYLKYQYPEWNLRYWSAVCEVHDKFKADELDRLWRRWTDGRKWLLAHPESPLPVLKRADFVASTHGMLQWVKDLEGSVGTIYVATEEGLLHVMRNERPDLDIRQAPVYTGCACAVCPYMKLNTTTKVTETMRGIGTKIDYLTETQMHLACKPVERMLEFQETGVVNLDA